MNWDDSSSSTTKHPLDAVTLAHQNALANCSSFLQRNESDQLSSENPCFHIIKSLLDLEEQYPASVPEGPPGWVHVLVQILYVVVCLIGLAGNTMVIYVVVRFSKMQTVTNLYIVNLAIADELFLIGMPFIVVTAVVGYWPFGSFLCKAYFATTSINQITSSLFLLVMSADRYLAVCHPINAPKWRTPFYAKVIAFCTWTLSVILMIPIFLYADTMEIEGKVNCNIHWPESGLISGDMIFMSYSFILAFAIPCIFMLIFYILVILRLGVIGPKRNNLSFGSNGSEAETGQQSSRARIRKKSHMKVTRIVLTVITVYILCWTPYWVAQIALLFTSHETPPSKTVVILFLLTGCLSYSNSAMNPILYAFLSDNFKKSFKKACACARKKVKAFGGAPVNNENSLFPMGKDISTATQRHRKFSTPMTSATYAGATYTELVTPSTSITRSALLQPSTSSLCQPSPPLSLHFAVPKFIPDFEDVSDIDIDSDSGNASDVPLAPEKVADSGILMKVNGSLKENGVSFSDQVNVETYYVQGDATHVTSL